MAKPTNLAEWGTGAAPIVEPTLGQKQAGWTSAFKPPAQWMNWWMNQVYLWIVWLNSFESTAQVWTALQTFNAGVTLGAASPLVANGSATFNGATTLAGATTVSGAAAFSQPITLNRANATTPALAPDDSYTGAPNGGGRRELLKVKVVGGANPIWFRILTSNVAGGLEFTFNAWWDGTNWQRDASTNGGGRIAIGSVGLVVYKWNPTNPANWPISDAAWTATAIFGQDNGSNTGIGSGTNTSRQLVTFDGNGKLVAATEQVQSAQANLTLNAAKVSVGANGARWYRDSNGRVAFQGSLNSIATINNGDQVATLDSTCFPPQPIRLLVASDQIVGYLDITTAGVVTVSWMPPNTFIATGHVIYLDGLTFRVQ